MTRTAKIIAMLGLLALCSSTLALGDNGLISHWKFDEGSGAMAYDSAGDNDGTIYGATWTTGQIDGALDFDGNEDYVEVPSSVSLDSTTATWSLWVKPTGDPGGSGSSPWGTGCIMTRGDSWGTWNGLHISLIPHATYGTIAIQVKANANPSVLVEDTVFSSPDITYNEWSHIAFVFDSGNYAELYVNGALTVNYTLGNFAFNNQVLRIATSTDPYLYDFNGEVDEVVIHDKALSAEEIQQLYQNGSAEAEVVELEITGPNEVAENFSASYKAIAYYDNNSTENVTELADWQVEPNTIASIDSGLLTTEDIDASEDATIYAQYTVGEVTVEAEKAVTIFNICPTGTALEFDGIDDYVEVGDKSILDFAADDSFTLLAWIKSDKAISAIVGKRRSTGAGGVFKEGYNLGIHLGVIEFGVEDVSGNRTGILHSGATVLNDDTWHHVVAVRDTQTGELRAYVDGFVDAPAVTDSTTTTLATSKSFQIGRRDTTHHGSNPNYFGGKIDDVRIYNRALSAEEIQANMHTRLTGVEPGLVAYWDFDEGEGQIVYDLSPNGNDGQLGSTPNPDNSDPAWAESDAPVGICTPVEVDIKPGSCPNPLNVASKGVLPVAILGSDTFDVTTIDAASIFLDGVPAIRSSLEDVAAPASDGNECDCNSPGPDGYSDLTLKFRTHRVVEELIDWPGELAQGETLLLTLTGELSDGTAIEGTDCVVLVGNVPRWLAARASDINEDGIINMLDLAEMAQYWLESSVVTD